MPDVYAEIEEADEAVQERLAEILELRAADAQQRAMRDDYLGDLRLPAGARVLELGCGTGAVVRSLAERREVAEAFGVDPSPVFIARARELAGDRDGFAFEVADGRDLPFEDGTFDAVVCHTSLCHIPRPEEALAEAARVTARDGRLAVFDGDYVTTTVATSPTDPLQACIDAAVESLVHDPMFVRRLPGLLRETGWEMLRMRSHGYTETNESPYMLSLIDRGADVLVTEGRAGEDLAAALKREARRRVEQGEFFGHIAYASVIAHPAGV
jgi:ubiquinone/menaquinone biosynthesis C-methylase UbiE